MVYDGWYLHLCDTAGKCHDRGFMAFDRQRTDTCHGVGQALHRFLLFFVNVGLARLDIGDQSAIISTFKTTAIEWWIRQDEKLWCHSNQNTGLSHADKGTKKFVQCLVNAMASVGPLPIKCHEPTVMALARSVRLGIDDEENGDGRKRTFCLPHLIG
ncbi:hypothetical protein B0H17DRAFT_1150554 [Mycena rosella]|uniref:Uncharacterized protein n=1 Tax=Mycena rosella TaxID=1033263 RepID=A0AAD7FKF9_MYCRO|nr:hypothetical protein B0H17DRAFT_1150554 [Mycena rosella]